VLETQTARLRRKGAVQLGANLEYKTSSEGHESGIPFVFEYGITDRLEWLSSPWRPGGSGTSAHEPRTRATEVMQQYLVAREGR
jgi:hypothetical protein